MENARPTSPSLPWLEPGDDFPETSQAWGEFDPAPGLLAGGGALDVDTLVRAYSAGVFPWFSAEQPILWWSPEPRMVLNMADFKVRRSLRKALKRFLVDPNCEVRIDTAFTEVIETCANRPRQGQTGTWIVPAMEAAYQRLHAAGLAHSVETWSDGKLVGGLYCVAIGQAVFGESMFSDVPDASKIALAALTAFCRHHSISLVDCQQNTNHLASLGAREISRSTFVGHIRKAAVAPGPAWQFDPVYWAEIPELTASTT